MKTTFLIAVVAIVCLLGAGCAHPPTHLVKVYIMDANVPPMLAQEKTDLVCSRLGFCSEFAYKLLSGERVCYGPDYRVADIANDPLKRCFNIYRPN